MIPETGSYYRVRFRTGFGGWQIGQVRESNGIFWVALPYNMAHYGLASFEFGEKL